VRDRWVIAAAIVGSGLSIVHAVLIGTGSADVRTHTTASVSGFVIRIREGWQASAIEWPEVPARARGTLSGRAAWWSVGPVDRDGSGQFIEAAFGFPFRSLRKGVHEFGGLETAFELRDPNGTQSVFPGSTMRGISTGVLWRGVIANAMIWALVFAAVGHMLPQRSARRTSNEPTPGPPPSGRGSGER